MPTDFAIGFLQRVVDNSHSVVYNEPIHDDYPEDHCTDNYQW